MRKEYKLLNFIVLTVGALIILSINNRVQAAGEYQFKQIAFEDKQLYNAICDIFNPVEVNESYFDKIINGTDNLNEIFKEDDINTIYITQEKLLTVKTLELSQKGIKSINDLHFFSNLERLDVSKNEISGESGTTITELTNLKYINISGNKNSVETNLLMYASMLDNLEVIYANNIFEGELPKIGNRIGFKSNKLQTISLADNGDYIFDVDFEYAAQAGSIKEVYLQNTAIPQAMNIEETLGTGFAGFGFTNSLKASAGSIETLNLSNTKIKEDMEVLADLSLLKSLDLSNNKIVDISILKNLPNLTYLNLQKNCIYNFSPILNFEHIEDFNIGMQELSGEVKQKIIQNETFKFSLPDIFIQAKKIFGKLYTSQNFTLDNVKINFWGDTATLNTSTIGDNEAVIVINGGMLDKSYIIIKYSVEEASTTNGNTVNNIVKNNVILNNTITNNAVSNNTVTNNTVTNNTVTNNTVTNNTVTNNTITNNTVTNNTVTNNTVTNNAVTNNTTNNTVTNNTTVADNTVRNQVNLVISNSVEPNDSKKDDQGKDDTTIPIEKLPSTGDNDFMQIILCVVVVTACFAAVQYLRYKDVK